MEDDHLIEGGNTRMNTQNNAMLKMLFTYLQAMRKTNSSTL
jgi:hypothetical protein